MKYLILAATALLLSGCVTNQSLVVKAKREVGSFYKKGQSKKCAEYIARLMEGARIQPPEYPNKARNWESWGTGVPWALKRPGDVIVVWRNSLLSGDGHILLYVGDGKAVHRPTYKFPIQEVDVAQYSGRVTAVRRPPAPGP